MSSSNELNINGIYYKVAQINGQKIAEPMKYFGPEPPENAEIFVSNLPVNWTENEILPILAVPGFVVKLRLMMRFSGQNRGFCYVLYANQQMAHNALNYLLSQPIFGVRLYVAWSHNNKNLILGGIHATLGQDYIFEKILNIVKPTNIDFQLSDCDKVAILTFPTHRDAALARRSMMLHVSGFGPKAFLRWLKPNFK